MVETDEKTLEVLLHRGRWLTFPDFVRLIEQHHPHEEAGVTREVLEAYAAAIVDDLGAFAPFTVDGMERQLAMHLTDSDVWLDTALYAVSPGRISVYPAPWHDRLHDETDPREYVRVMRDEIAAARGYTTRGQAAPGVPKPQLIDAMMLLGGMDLPSAAGMISEMRKRGELLLFPFQNPEAEVQLPADGEEEPQIPAAAPVEVDSSETTAAEPAEDESDPAARIVLPPLVDIRDDLEYLEAHGSPEVDEQVEDIATTLETLSSRKLSSEAGALDEIDSALLRLETETEGTLERRTRSARNRVRLYRRALEDASNGLSVVGLSIRHGHTGHRVPLPTLRGFDAEVRGTVLNEGESRDVIPIVVFYDDDHRTVSKAKGTRSHVERDGEQAISVPVHVPPTAWYYTVTPLDAEDYLIEYQFQT